MINFIPAIRLCRRARKKQKLWRVHIHFTSCTINLHSCIHEVRKVRCNNFHVKVQLHGCELPLYDRTSPTLSIVRFLRLANSSPTIQRSPARPSCNVREPSHKNLARCLASFLNDFRQLPDSGKLNAAEFPRGNLQDNSQYAAHGHAMSASQSAQQTMQHP